MVKRKKHIKQTIRRTILCSNPANWYQVITRRSNILDHGSEVGALTKNRWVTAGKENSIKVSTCRDELSSSIHLKFVSQLKWAFRMAENCALLWCLGLDPAIRYPASRSFNSFRFHFISLAHRTFLDVGTLENGSDDRSDCATSHNVRVAMVTNLRSPQSPERFTKRVLVRRLAMKP